MPALFHPNRFQKELDSMAPQELLELAASTRRKFDITAVGTGCQIVAAIPSQGTSLFGMVYSGPRLAYYGVKKHIIKEELESRNLRLDPRSKRDFIIPAVVGAVGLGLGAGADAIGHLSGGAAEQIANMSPPALNAAEWTRQAIRSGFDSTYNHLEVLFHPTAAAHLAEAEYAAAYSGDMDEHVQNGFDRFDRVVDTILPGGLPLFSERTAELVGEGVAATVIGEVVGEGMERCFPDATRNVVKYY